MDYLRSSQSGPSAQRLKQRLSNYQLHKNDFNNWMLRLLEL